MHFRTHTKRTEPRAGGALAVALPRHDGRPRQARRAAARRCSTRSGSPRTRSSMYSTDNGPHMNIVAGRGDDAVPQREEHELGGRVPRAADGPLARARSRQASSRTRSSATTTGCRRSSPRRASRTSCEKLQGGHEAAGKTLQGARRRLQPPAVPDGRGGARARATGFFYFSRRRRPGRAPLRQLEDRLHGAAGARARSQLWAEPFVAAPGAEALQPADRPVRAGRHHLEHLLGLVLSTRLHDPARAGDRRRVPGDVRGVPARQKAASFTIDQALEKMAEAAGGAHD